jgi:hypothetical protein
MADNNPSNGQGIPERDIKQNSGVSASMALQATQKAWDLRQAANAAGDPNAREEILAKAINKEIEAESFGKAAKYTQSGAFQGLAAGAGLGVQPGVTLGKITGALVGGTVSTVTGLLGGGIGSVYGAMNGPMWNLGEMASHGVRGVIGDFPNWKSTPSQKKALEKMVMQTKETQAPSKEELEKMKAEAPDDMPQSWSQSVKDMTSWRPSMPSMPSMPKGGAALGLGGLGASMPSWGGQGKDQGQQQASRTKQVEGTRQKPHSTQSSKQRTPAPQQVHSQQRTSKPSAPKPTPRSDKTTQSRKEVAETQPSEPSQAAKATTTQGKTSSSSNKASKPTQSSRSEKPNTTSTQTNSTPRSTNAPSKNPARPQSTGQLSASGQADQATSDARKEHKPTTPGNAEKRKPRKLTTKSTTSQPSQDAAPKRAPRKLETRKAAS